MTTEELRSRIAAGGVTLIHVLPEEVFEARRIPGSANACVYEVAFLEKVSALVADPSAPVIVYGAGEGSLDSRTAAEALRAAGYGHVSEYAEGLAGWERAGGELEGHGNLPGTAGPQDGTYAVDAGASVIRWTGRNLFNHHSGTVHLAGGEIRIAGGSLVSAAFRIAMDTIACEDIADPALNALLIRHLHSGDFFDVARHPFALFEATKAVPLAGSTEGTENYEMIGTFTVRGVARPMRFAAVLAWDGARRVSGQGQLSFDRTAFGSIYGSGKFFRFLGKHVVNDVVDLHVKVHADLV